ncbi:phage tail terminator protein [Shigella sonnei]
MKRTEFRAAVLDALENMTPRRRFLMVAPLFLMDGDFPAIAVYLTGTEYTGEELDSDTWQAELDIEVLLPAQVPDSELDRGWSPDLSGDERYPGTVRFDHQYGWPVAMTTGATMMRAWISADSDLCHYL